MILSLTQRTSPRPRTRTPPESLAPGTSSTSVRRRGHVTPRYLFTSPGDHTWAGGLSLRTADDEDAQSTPSRRSAQVPLPGAAWLDGHRRRWSIGREPQDAVGDRQRPLGDQPRDGGPAVAGLRNHGRELACSAGPVRPLAGREEPLLAARQATLGCLVGPASMGAFWARVCPEGSHVEGYIGKLLWLCHLEE